MAEPQVTITDGGGRKIMGRGLYRSITNRSVAGVCGGLGERFGIDVGVVRVVWLASVFLTLGVTLLVYIPLALLIPKETVEHAAAKQVPSKDLWQRIRQNSALLWGAIVLLTGAVLLAGNFGLLPEWLERISGVFTAILWPLLLIGAGVYLLLSFTGRAPDWRRLQQVGARLPLRRSRQDRVLAGVCGGLAQYLNIDPLVVRIAWAVLSAATVGTLGVLIYAAAAVLIPVGD